MDEVNDLYLTSGDQYVTTPGIRPPMLPGFCFYPWFLRLILGYRSAVLRGKGDGDDYFSARSLEVIRRLEHCGCRFEISGLNHLRCLQGPAVFVSNHMSTLETVALPGIIHPLRPSTFVVKNSLVKGFIFGPIMRSRDPVVVTRKSPRADLVAVLREGRRRLNQGISVVLFPQGTRRRAFHMDRFNSLGVKLARNSKVPVVPLALKTDCWSNGLLIRPLGRIQPERTIRIAFAPPIGPLDASTDAHEKTLAFIIDKLTQWGVRIVPGKGGFNPPEGRLPSAGAAAHRNPSS